MNSNTYEELDREGIIERMKARGEVIIIDEGIPDGLIHRTEVLDIGQLKHQAEKEFYPQKTRTGYTKPGMQTRDKTKAKAARAARKRNRK